MSMHHALHVLAFMQVLSSRQMPSWQHLLVRSCWHVDQSQALL